ncbi:ABC transporter ATP-binding protein [Bifidobacterium avesanii]|uniref:ATP-binding cassette domain-containing protein n=1 Tax=Bifidobacterium avesanii TaxID=1798157 RepID=A0A7K3TJF1_9BIFI|nr:ABC transporter ATP-binding protein [Bifidobacterium avesanii]KAB8289598.1 ABC transporter [Bifidobacterium avesanii]NEG79151.1 ATP-binding cassette domain-containing protein [Bifidobacterium avesanii]
MTVNTEPASVGYVPVPPDPSAAVSIRGLVKVFDRKVAVDGLALDIPVGSFYGLVGPNGAGKTTTLNMLTGLLRPDAGSAMILGRDVWSDVNAAKRAIGVMPQPDQIFDRLTGLQLLVYAGMLRGMRRDEVVRRANDLLSAFDLTDAAGKMVTDYSAGMTKKICLATAMIHSPRILVLDEPFESVDPVSSANLKDILLEYARTGGTVIISSHVMALVERMCTHVAIVNHGQVCAAGTVDEVAAGEDLEDRFMQLVGGRHAAARIDWLNGGAGEADGSAAGTGPTGPTEPTAPTGFAPAPQPMQPPQAAQPPQFPENAR